MIVKTFAWQDEAATAAFATRLAQHWRAQPQDADMLIFLHGDLGAGKTTFTRHLLRALGVQGRIKSPTFAVAENYQLADGNGGAHLTIWHCDFYRFDDPREWEDSGLRDLFAGTGLKLVEWPEKAGALLPRPDWDVQLHATDDTARTVHITAHSPRGMNVLQRMAQP